MNRHLARLGTLAALFGTSGTCGWSYIRLNTYDSTPVNLQRTDNAAIQFYLNTQIAPALQLSTSGKIVNVITADSDPQAAAAGAAAAWTAVSSANAKFLPIKSTTVGHDPADGMMVISVATSAADVSAVGGAIAITANVWATSPVDKDGDIFDSDILLNPVVSFSTNGTAGTNDLQGVLTHEMGHALGANHTAVLGATMFQYAGPTRRLLSSDDVAFVTAAYPATSAPKPATISGKISITGTIGLPYAFVTFIDTAQGITLSGLTNTDGTYSIQAPAGTYIMYAEPFNSIVQPVNVYGVDPSAVQAFQPTMLGGLASPTPITVTAGGIATANLTANAGVAIPFPLPYLGFGGAGRNGDVANVSSIGGPIVVGSGISLDLALIGPSLDQTTTVAVYGPGITAGPVRVDSAEGFGGSLSGLPLLRTMLSVALRSEPALATILITNGGQTVALTGVLVIGPPPPTFTASAVVNAGVTTATGIVAPGEIVSIYGSNLGPDFAHAASYSFSSANILSKEIGNTRVLFDGVPAPLLFSYSGQVNAIAPYGLAGKSSTKMQVEYLGVQSTAVPLTVSPTSPGILPGSNPQQGLAQNASDYSVNGPLNPASRGGFVILYGTGEGPTNPAGTDGLGQSGFGTTARLPLAGVSATVGGIASPSVGAATVSISGLAQFNVQIPSGLAATGAVPVVVTVDGVSAAPVNIYVQ